MFWSLCLTSKIFLIATTRLFNVFYWFIASSTTCFGKRYLFIADLLAHPLIIGRAENWDDKTPSCSSYITAPPATSTVTFGSWNNKQKFSSLSLWDRWLVSFYRWEHWLDLDSLRMFFFVSTQLECELICNPLGFDDWIQQLCW